MAFGQKADANNNPWGDTPGYDEYGLRPLRPLNTYEGRRGVCVGRRRPYGAEVGFCLRSLVKTRGYSPASLRDCAADFFRLKLVTQFRSTS